MKLQAQIAIDREDKIRWLVIESDENDTKGYFLYKHLNDKFAYDTWFKTIPMRLSQAAQTPIRRFKRGIDWLYAVIILASLLVLYRRLTDERAAYGPDYPVVPPFKEEQTDN